MLLQQLRQQQLRQLWMWQLHTIEQQWKKNGEKTPCFLMLSHFTHLF
jgi:hypothetical protein